VSRISVLFAAWQNPSSRSIVPVARLLRDAQGAYEFAYIRQAELAREQGFCPFVTFPELERVYRSAELPPLFTNRLMPSSRPDFPAFVSQLSLDQHADPLDILARSGGRRATDTIEVFSPPTFSNEGQAETFVLARGTRHVPGAEDAIGGLSAGEVLLVMHDLQNPFGKHALALRTEGQAMVGYLPDYLALELARTDASTVAALSVTVERVNAPPAPSSHRLLCRVVLPESLRTTLFQGEQYAPIASTATRWAA
jgi:hypothetical protein